jgi:hypothetical protein
MSGCYEFELDQPIMRKALFFVFLSLVLAGCQSTPETTYNDYAQFRLNQIIVDFTQTERPVLVAELDSEISRKIATSGAGAFGVRMGLVKQAEREAAYTQEIERNIKPHLRDALSPLMQGSHPVNVLVEVQSAFIRSRAGLTRLIGTEVIVNGQRRPSQEQFIANIVLIDAQTGVRFERIGPITKTDDGAVVLWEGGPKAPDYGKGKRLNKLIFEFSQEVAKRMKQRDITPIMSDRELEALLFR